MPDTIAGRWLRRYRWIFLLIAVVLLGQLVLAYLLPKLTSSGLVDNRQSHSGDPGASSALRPGVFTTLFSTPGTRVAGDRSTGTTITVSRSTATAAAAAKHVLRPGQVTVSPGCTIATKEAVSAIHRAQTARCKQHIADVTCAIQAGQFYAHTLPNSCPNGSFIANRALGCFRDAKKARLLPGYYTNFKQLNTPGKCIQLCLQSGFLYAGVQYGSECFCGNDMPSPEKRLNATDECNYSCVGEPSQLCGGYFAVDVYETGISKFVPQVADLIANATDDSTAKIAFLLTLNGRAVRQVHRLLRALYSPHHFYYIHVDSRQDYLYQALLPLERHAPNIRLARQRYSTIWGGASLLRMLLAAMNDLRHMADWRWDFVINLSESDFPVKTVERLAEFLSANRDRNFVKSHGREVQRFIQKQGLDKTFVECDTHMWRTGDRSLPAGIQIDGGSDWVALSRPFVEYVCAGADNDQLVAGLLRIFNHTLLPAESFFHTALRNSRFCNTYVDNNLHVTNWKRKLGCKCQYKHVVDWCGCSPNDFRPDDWPRLLATEAKQMFFARKFEPVVSQAVILKLETWLFGQSAAVDVPNVRSYWQNVYEWSDERSEGEEVLYDLGESVLRLQLAHRLLAVIIVTQVNIFMENDQHRGFLVRAFVTLRTQPDLPVEVEVWARHEQMPQSSRSLPIGKRILHLEVSSDFDQKEQLARNFVRTIGPHSEPVVVMHFSEAPTVARVLATATSAAPATFNCTCLWLNPAGRLEDVSEMHVEESPMGFSVHFSKPTLRAPLLAGVWTVQVVHKGGVVAKCDFFVMPARDNHSVLLFEVDIVGRTMTTATDQWSAYLPKAAEQANRTATTLREANLMGAERAELIDRMVRRFVLLRGECAVSGEPAAAAGIPVCERTKWSSLAPDPKSDIYADLRGATET